MTIALILAVANFSKVFVLKVDASRDCSISGIGLSTYEKEFLAILIATQK